MSTFISGSNGANVLTSFLTAGTTASTSVSTSQATITYTNGSSVVLSGNFTVNGSSLSGGTLTGWASYASNGALNWSVSGFSADLQTIVLDDELGLYTSITTMIFTPGSTYYGSTNPGASDVLVGLGGNDTFIGGAATELFEPGSGTNTITGGTGTNAVKFGGTLSSYGIVNNGGGAITVTDSVLSLNGIDHISGVQTLQFLDVNASVTSAGTLSLPAASVSQAIAWSTVGDLAPIAISDYSTAVVLNLSGLQTLANAGELGSVTLRDGGTPTLSISPAQLSADIGVLEAIVSAATISVDASAANLTMTGVGTLGTIAVFTKPAADYSVVANSDGSVTVTDTGTGRTSVDHLSKFTALQFADQTDIVAAAPASGGAVTTGNVTELYSAVFGREPDVGGLSFYQNYLTSNPGTPLTTFAQWFLSSAEYTGNAAHNYAQTTTGETQFITDLYTNLLHRAPDTGAVPFYLNVITSQTAHDTPGTAQYTADDAYAHALVVTYVSQSAEFLSDVQITGQATTSPQHWLVVS